jgi:hypothetical protein
VERRHWRSDNVGVYLGRVELTGELKGDTITATKIVAPVKSAK